MCYNTSFWLFQSWPPRTIQAQHYYYQQRLKCPELVNIQLVEDQIEVINVDEQQYIKNQNPDPRDRQICKKETFLNSPSVKAEARWLVTTQNSASNTPTLPILELLCIFQWGWFQMGFQRAILCMSNFKNSHGFHHNYIDDYDKL